MEDREIDLKLREVFRRNEPSFEQSQADRVTQAASSRHVPRGRRRGVLRLVTITVAVLAVGIAVAAGVWQAIAHLGGNNPIVLITDQTRAYHLASLWWLIAIIVVFIIAIIALIVAGRAMARARAAARPGGASPRGAVGQPGAPGTGPEAQRQAESLRMLEERYAKGEISREEYMQRQTDLQTKV